MTETLLSYLTRRNPTILAYARPAVTYTFNSDWDPIEGVREWTDFNYKNLEMRFRNELSRHVSSLDATKNCEEGGYNKIFDERGLSDLLCMSIMGPVSAVLPSSFITSSGRVTQHPGCIPDWGAGKDGATGRAQALLVGDTKFNWRSTSALDAVNTKRGFYEDSPLIDMVRPMEQVQFYGSVYGCRYVYIISDQDLVVMRLHLAPAPVRTSPRPQRNRNRALPSHQRVASSSTNSKQATDMTIDESCFKASIGLVEYKRIPWSATSGLTIKLALYCLVRLAAEDGSDLKIDYPPVISQMESSLPQRLPTTVLPAPQAPNSIPTASTVATAPQASNDTIENCYNTTVIWNQARTGYTYRNHHNQWIFDDSPSNWQEIGNRIYKFQGAPPFACSSKPV